MYNFYNRKKIISHLILIVFFISLLSTAISQGNKSGLVKIYLSYAKDYSAYFHNINLSAAFDIQTMPFFGLGYTIMKLADRDNRFIQGSISYNIGYHLKQSTISHNITASIHSNYITKVDLNPFVYGLTLHFMAISEADEVYDNLTTNEYPGALMSNFYIRPEIGLSLPLKYDKKITSCLITYGYNIQTFWNRNEIKKYKEDIKNNENIDNSFMPYTSKSHHMVTLKINFRIIPKKSRTYF